MLTSNRERPSNFLYGLQGNASWLRKRPMFHDDIANEHIKSITTLRPQERQSPSYFSIILYWSVDLFTYKLQVTC